MDANNNKIEELLPGARNAVSVCLNVQPGQRVYILADRRGQNIGLALQQAALEAQAVPRLLIIEDYAPRPTKEYPEELLTPLKDADVCLYCAYPQKDELPARMQFVSAVDANHVKYAHMVGITEQIMCQGMRADYRKVDAISRRILDRAQTCKTVRVKSRAGTDVVATFYPEYFWRKTSGIIEEVWSNLPGGEVFTCPASVDGTFVVDGTVGDYFSEKYGVLDKTPMTLEIEGGYLKKATCENKELEKEFWEYCHKLPHSDRIGEFAIGTNLAVFEFIGNLLQDEKMPGVHIAFGDPYGSQTGADWSCKTHVDVITRSCDIWIDDEQIMQHGIFISESLGIDYTYLYEDQSLLQVYAADPDWKK
ncbi:aminopeptidase [bacterium]|nr:aminopeptidase [bacterium]